MRKKKLKLQISFCYRWNYGKEAARVVEEIFTNKDIRDEIVELSLKEAPLGHFIIKKNDETIFHNKQMERMLNNNEIIELIKGEWWKIYLQNIHNQLMKHTLNICVVHLNFIVHCWDYHYVH